MARKLITCPVCHADQHIYNNKIARHEGETILTCDGSGLSIDAPEVVKLNTTLTYNH